MKLILGDNQFFGINHADLKKAESTKKKFSSPNQINDFILESIKLGMNGFMINSNDIGYKIVKKFKFKKYATECHYSIPYPHKYASMVNESGIISLLIYVIKNFRVFDVVSLIKFAVTRNSKYLIPLMLRLEIPNNLPKGSVIYLQNIITDLIMGLNNAKEIFSWYIKSIKEMGYKPGFITLNLDSLKCLLIDHYSNDEIHICFNLNASNFNVFPNLEMVLKTIKSIKSKSNWKLMGMSIFSSGINNITIKESIEFIKNKNLDFVVFGTSKLDNLKSNIKLLR